MLISIFSRMFSVIKIRKATITDAEMMAALASRTFWDAFHKHPKNAPQDMADYMSKAFNLEQIQTEINDENNIFLLAEIENSPAGYAKLVIGSIEEPIIASKPIELSRLYAEQAFIGKGIGQKLMDECFIIAEKLECDVMWLGVWEYNPRAQRFYEKQGFEVVGQHIFQLGTDAQTDLLMVRKLTRNLS